MGSRAQVLIEDEGVYLYTHWGADGIFDVVKMALKSSAGQGRLNDPEYLARIIFDEMVGEDQGSETGFGIGTSEHGDNEKLVIVNCGEKTVKFEDFYSEEEGEVLEFSEL